jgi:hypothetical protein
MNQIRAFKEKEKEGGEGRPQLGGKWKVLMRSGQWWPMEGSNAWWPMEGSII